MMARLIHEMPKCKEKEPQDEDAAMVLRQSKYVTHCHAKMQGHTSIATNRATLRVFLQRKTLKMQKCEDCKGQG